MLVSNEEVLNSESRTRFQLPGIPFGCGVVVGVVGAVGAGDVAVGVVVVAGVDVAGGVGVAGAVVSGAVVVVVGAVAVAVVKVGVVRVGLGLGFLLEDTVNSVVVTPDAVFLVVGFLAMTCSTVCLLWLFVLRWCARVLAVRALADCVLADAAAKARLPPPPRTSAASRAIKREIWAVNENLAILSDRALISGPQSPRLHVDACMRRGSTQLVELIWIRLAGVAGRSELLLASSLCERRSDRAGATPVRQRCRTSGRPGERRYTGLPPNLMLF
jgi:hypothetical protein